MCRRLTCIWNYRKAVRRRTIRLCTSILSMAAFPYNMSRAFDSVRPHLDSYCAVAPHATCSPRASERQPWRNATTSSFRSKTERTRRFRRRSFYSCPYRRPRQTSRRRRRYTRPVSPPTMSRQSSSSTASRSSS